MVPPQGTEAHRHGADLGKRGDVPAPQPSNVAESYVRGAVTSTVAAEVTIVTAEIPNAAFATRAAMVSVGAGAIRFSTSRITATACSIRGSFIVHPLVVGSCWLTSWTLRARGLGPQQETTIRVVGMLRA